MPEHRHAQAALAQPAPEPTRDRRLAAVRTADTAITGTGAGSIVMAGPSSTKSAPQASAREARCMTWGCETSL